MKHIMNRGTVFHSIGGSARQSHTFPQIAVLPGGRWICGCRAGWAKGDNKDQHVVISWSDDRGRSWSNPISPFQPPAFNGAPGLFRTIGLTALGHEEVVAVLCWVNYSDASLPLFNEQTEGLLDCQIFLSRSMDGGATWSLPWHVETPFDVPVPLTGPLLLMPDGEWVCQFELNKHYNDPVPWVHGSVLLFSADQGRTWPRHTIVTRDPGRRMFYWDQRPQVLRDGTLLDVFWTYDNQAATYRNIHARRSIDGGRTWSELQDTGVPGQPAPPIELDDGVLAMVYVDRTAAPAICCRVSVDHGVTWPAHTRMDIYRSELAAQSGTKSGMTDAWAEMTKFSVGLPATALLPDGDLLVVYYQGPETDTTNIEWVQLSCTAITRAIHASAT